MLTCFRAVASDRKPVPEEAAGTGDYRYRVMELWSEVRRHAPTVHGSACLRHLIHLLNQWPTAIELQAALAPLECSLSVPPRS